MFRQGDAADLPQPPNTPDVPRLSSAVVDFRATAVRSIGYPERGVNYTASTGIEVLVRVGLKWRKIAQG